MSASAFLSVTPLDFQWPTADPFLFCVYHDDNYPRGSEAMGQRSPGAQTRSGALRAPRRRPGREKIWMTSPP